MDLFFSSRAALRMKPLVLPVLDLGAGTASRVEPLDPGV